MKRFLEGALIVLFVALTTTVYAFGPYGAGLRKGPHPAHFRCSGFDGGALYSNLDLTQEQQEKMWQAREKYRNETSSIRYQMFKKRVELKNLYSDPSATDAAIMAKQKEMNALRQTMQDKKVQHRLEQRKILTPEQIKKLGEVGFGGRKTTKSIVKGRGMGPSFQQ